MPAIDLFHSAASKPMRPPQTSACEAGGTHETGAPCPYRHICKSPICRGDWSNPDCPGSRLASRKGQ